MFQKLTRAAYPLMVDHSSLAHYRGSTSARNNICLVRLLSLTLIPSGFSRSVSVSLSLSLFTEPCGLYMLHMTAVPSPLDTWSPVKVVMQLHYTVAISHGIDIHNLVSLTGHLCKCTSLLLLNICLNQNYPNVAPRLEKELANDLRQSGLTNTSTAIIGYKANYYAKRSIHVFHSNFDDVFCDICVKANFTTGKRRQRKVEIF